MKPFQIVRLGAEHNRASFTCGQEALDRYLRNQATQDIRRYVANCFVAVESATGRVAAYYTLAATSVPLIDLPAEVTKKLPCYPVVPAVLIGRLAVDLAFQGQGLGRVLLVDAVRQVLAAAPAAHLLLVDAKDEGAARFYRRNGFIPLESRPLTLFQT